MNETLQKFGFRMPAEWEPHNAVWLAWPYDKITFGSLNEKDDKVNPNRLKIVENVFRQIIEALKDSEEIKLLKRDQVDYADVWTRDYMPTFVKNSENKIVAIKWIYNAYGEKFEGLLKDNNVWKKLNEESKIDTINTEIILESGAIEVNGAGMLITTEECMIKRGLTKEVAEKAFSEYLGISRVVWLKNGLINDHTDGHIDELARFVAENKVVCAYEDNQQDENYKILDENYKILTSTNLEVIKLPMPHMAYSNGTKTPASYTNFYISNKVVLAPTFNDPNDARAIEIIQLCFPDRKVIAIDCSELIYGGGALHCITQQEPK